MVSFGRSILFSSSEKFGGTKNSFFELDNKEAHQENVLLLNMANFDDLIILKSFFILSDFNKDIFKSEK